MRHHRESYHIIMIICVAASSFKKKKKTPNLKIFVSDTILLQKKSEYRSNSFCCKELRTGQGLLWM